MPVKIRLTRMGKKRQPTYRVVVMDSRSPRDGRYIDQIGRYDPRQEPSLIEIDNDKALDWLEKGAQPTDAARRLLEVSGAWTRFRVARGDIHTIDAPPAPAAKAPTAAEVEAEEEPGVTPEIHVVETFEEDAGVEAAAGETATRPAAAAEEPVAEEPLAEEPVAEEPAAAEPVAVEESTAPAAESGAVEEPTAPDEEPGAHDDEEAT